MRLPVRLRCNACGMAFRSMGAEAFHRHNFPVLCKKNSRAWKDFQREIAEATRKDTDECSKS